MLAVNYPLRAGTDIGAQAIRHLFQLDPANEHSLQKQIVEQIVAAIAGGHIGPEQALPSSRALAAQLNVARNTVTLAYNRLRDDGVLIAKERSGFFVNAEFVPAAVARMDTDRRARGQNRPDWPRLLQGHPSSQRNIAKPGDWQRYPYAFIYGQLDFDLFPINQWRECCRDAMSVAAVRDWANDQVDADDPLLLEQIHKHILPRRGVWAHPDEILVTVGAQQALYMIARLLLSRDKLLGLEDPGYVDMRNIAKLNPVGIRPLAVDAEGLIISDRIDDCDAVYVTPSHQSPTTVTMPLERREALLSLAAREDFFVIEDDYESEMAYAATPIPALKSLDRDDRVLYVGSLSKTLAPGLRVGYVVGPREIVLELRALRRLILRHPAANNQRSVALFLARGYYESLIRNLRSAYQRRSEAMRAALDRHLPDSSQVPGFGGSSYWVRGKKSLDARILAERAAEQGILIEPGDIHFLADSPPRNFFRLGFSSIATERIEPGIERLAGIINTLA